MDGFSNMHWLAQDAAPEVVVSTALILAALAYALWRILVAVYDALFAPLYVERLLVESPSAFSAVDAANVQYCRAETTDGDPYGVVNRVKSAGEDVLPPYPNGWFRVVLAQSLRPGDVLPFRAFGVDMVVFRSVSGRAHVLDAWCPHLGAHLGVGGKVDGEEIVCPFHGWRFDGCSGKCTAIPYSPAPVPEMARLRRWHSMEYLGQLMVWYDAEGRAPLWYPPEEPRADGYRFHCASVHDVRAHIAEIPENGADLAHLGFLHTPLIAHRFGIDRLLRHRWAGSWKAGEGNEQHLAHIAIDQSVALLGRELGFTRISVKITQIGMGCVTLFMDTPFGVILLIENVTPRGPLLQRVGHTMLAEPRVPRWFVKFVFRGTLVQFERDVPIWNNKIYLRKPLLVKGDGPIAQYRSWLRKNYSESSDDWRARAQTLEW